MNACSSGGELTLQAGQVTADGRLKCMIIQPSKHRHKVHLNFSQRSGQRAPSSYVCEVWGERQFYFCQPLEPLCLLPKKALPNCWYNLCYKLVTSRGLCECWEGTVVRSWRDEMSRWYNEHDIGAGIPKIGKEATEEKKLNSEGNTENMTRLIGRTLVVDWMGVYQIDGRKAIWVWIILAGITVWDFVTLFVSVAQQKLIAISQAISCILGWETLSFCSWFWKKALGEELFLFIVGTSDGNASQNNWEAIHVQLDTTMTC